MINQLLEKQNQSILLEALRKLGKVDVSEPLEGVLFAIPSLGVLLENHLHLLIEVLSEIEHQKLLVALQVVLLLFLEADVFDCFFAFFGIDCLLNPNVLLLEVFEVISYLPLLLVPYIVLDFELLFELTAFLRVLLF